MSKAMYAERYRQRRRTIVGAGLLLLAMALHPTGAIHAQGPGGHGGAPMPGHMGQPGGFGGARGTGFSGGRGTGDPNAPVNGYRGNNPTGSSPGISHVPGPPGRWWDDGGYARSVGLTTDQQRRMDSVFQQNRSALVSGLDNLRKAQGRLTAASSVDNPSESAVLTEIQNVAQARADLDKAYTHMSLQIRHEMTNDQIDKLEKLK